MDEVMLGCKKDAPTAPKGTKPLVHLPSPAKNLGAHLKKPASGEIVTSHHRGAKKR